METSWATALGIWLLYTGLTVVMRPSVIWTLGPSKFPSVQKIVRMGRTVLEETAKISSRMP